MITAREQNKYARGYTSDLLETPKNSSPTRFLEKKLLIFSFGPPCKPLTRFPLMRNSTFKGSERERERAQRRRRRRRGKKEARSPASLQEFVVYTIKNISIHKKRAPMGCAHAITDRIISPDAKIFPLLAYIYSGWLENLLRNEIITTRGGGSGGNHNNNNEV